MGNASIWWAWVKHQLRPIFRMFCTFHRAHAPHFWFVAIFSETLSPHQQHFSFCVMWIFRVNICILSSYTHVYHFIYDFWYLCLDIVFTPFFLSRKCSLQFFGIHIFNIVYQLTIGMNEILRCICIYIVFARFSINSHLYLLLLTQIIDIETYKSIHNICT